MKKGITLIELLAVIIILAIIGSISFITIGNIVKNSKINLYNENITKIKDTAEMYISNGNKGYIEEGQTVEITLDELIEDGYLKEVKSPFDKTKTCNGYVLVTKLENNEYSYIPHINCEEDINNSTEDGLVLHYTFDDFQEPTENLLTDNGIINWSVGNLVSSVTIAAVIPNEKYIISSNNVNGTFRFYVPLIKLVSGETYTFSYKYKILTGTIFQMSDWNDYALQNIVNLDYGDYQFSSATGTSFCSSVYHFMDFFISENTQVEIWDVQLEKKDHCTPYINGSRTGIVKDYSINNNSSNLSLTNTPKWMYEEGIENGEYSFNGSNTYISLNNIDASQPYTVLLWAKANTVLIDGANPPTGLNGKTLIVGPGPVWNPGIWVTKDNLRIHCSNYHKDYHITWDDLGWHSVGQIYDGNDCYAIFDGNILQPYRTTVYNPPVTSTLLIGAETFVGSTANWDGLIDDVRIYSRALSEKEIRNIYYLTK